MATAVKPTAEPRTGSPTTRLVVASLVGAVFLLAGLVAVGYVVPQALRGLNLGNPFVAAFVRLVAQVAAVAALVYAGSALAGDNPPKGLRGGIFLAISTIITLFFLIRAVGLNLDGNSGPIVTAVVAAALVFGAFKFLTSPRAIRWMHTIEGQGWFSTHGYKRTQGLKLRRYTIIGILLVGLTGVWSLLSHYAIGVGDLSLTLPFTSRVVDGKTVHDVVTVLTDKQYAVPLLLAGMTLWVAWRAVNVPAFADFLIATEAEMNKVSWTPRSRLIQDTIVVLVTTLLLTTFLLVVDLFWGWLLSNKYIGVLPNPGDRAKTTEVKKADW